MPRSFQEEIREIASRYKARSNESTDALVHELCNLLMIGLTDSDNDAASSEDELIAKVSDKLEQCDSDEAKLAVVGRVYSQVAKLTGKAALEHGTSLFINAVLSMLQ